MHRRHQTSTEYGVQGTSDSSDPIVDHQAAVDHKKKKKRAKKRKKATGFGEGNALGSGCSCRSIAVRERIRNIRKHKAKIGVQRREIES